MSSFFKTSIGKKVIMSVTGLFLIVFLLVHLTLNLLVLVDEDGSTFNTAAHFMGTNPIMKVMEIVLAAGFVFHMLYATILTLKNQAARPIKYAVSNNSDSSWSSRNMYITGSTILAFLILHLLNYFYKIKFTDLIDSGQMSEYELVKGLFQPENWYFSAFYILAFTLLGLHLNHSFQSSFQTLGLNNSNWIPRLNFIGALYAIIIAVGFSIIPIFFLMKSLL
jgi:succinate dehydrogenase / fumarate reductase, cytochrome b subunit